MPPNQISPELIQALAKAGVIPERRSDLERQFDYATALRRNQTNYPGIGGLYGGLGNVLNSVTSALMYNQGQDKQKEYLDQLQQIAAQYGQTVAGQRGMMADPNDPMNQLAPPWRPTGYSGGGT